MLCKKANDLFNIFKSYKNDWGKVTKLKTMPCRTDAKTVTTNRSSLHFHRLVYIRY